MKKLFAGIMVLNCLMAKSQEINIIPKPVELRIGKGNFIITKQTVIAYDEKTESSANFLNTYLKKIYHFELQMTMHNRDSKKAILLMSGGEQEKKGFYKLVSDINGISIAGDNEGVFYGIQTLIQLLPIQNQKPKIQNIQLPIPQLSIIDYPRFAYRGLHFDVGRHFFPVDFIKKYIDYIALHKMNYFHWHLTEDQGWRIEIKKYPKLTSVGAWRNGTIIGRYPGTGNDGIKYGGSYTQEQIKEIVKYAADRYITVVPEIEMPGHSSAAIAAYPELSCFPDEPTKIPQNMISSTSTLRQAQGDKKLVQETWGIFDDVFCAGKENTFKFLEDVMDEVLALFPSRYVHVGGDECPKEHWKKCPACQQRMKDNGLKDEHGLQSYFIQRMEKYLNKKGRTLIGWDEILEGGLAPNAVVMSWRGEAGGIEAAKQNHDVIMTPGNPVYFDHTQSQNEDSVTIGGYNPIEKVYAYEPIPKELNAEQAQHVLGAQANMWTEYMKNTKKVEYMLFPRISALSEVLWSKKENRDWKDFENRLMGQFKRYDLWKVNYSKAYFDLKANISQTDNYEGLRLTLTSKTKGTSFTDWTINDKPGGLSMMSMPRPFDGSVDLKIEESGTYTTKIFSGSTTKNATPLVRNSVTFHFNKATGKKITLTNPASDKYPGDGPFTLVNGVINEKGFAKSREFLGFNGTDCEAIIDLGSSQLVSLIVVNTLNRTSSWIWRPLTAEVFGSGDGQTWYSLKMTDDFVLKDSFGEEKKDGTGKGMMTMSFKATYAQFVKVVITNWGEIPAGNPGAGNKPWLFVDEIEVN